MQKFIYNYNLISYYGITFIFSFVLLFLHFVFQTVGKFSLSFTQFAPAIAVIFMAYVLKDSTTIKSITNHFKFDSVLKKWLLIAIVIPTFLVIFSSFLLSYFSTNFTPWRGDVLFYILNFIAIVLGCIAEEIGWRGYLLPNLQKNHNPFISSLIVGILWGIWHLNFTGGVLGFVLYTLTIIEMSICMTWLFNKTQGNLWLMSIWHISFNISSHIFLWNRFDLSLFMIEAIIFGILCSIFLIYDHKSFFITVKPESCT